MDRLPRHTPDQASERRARSLRPGRREARLRPEFAALYPPLRAGQWESAALMTERLIAWLLQEEKHGLLVSERVLRPEHFEFRSEGNGDPAQ
jgi:hypothetical protein